MTEGGNTYYYSHDGGGSTRLLTDPYGVPVNRYDYTAFGEPFAPSTAEEVLQRYVYQGRERHPINPALNFRNRDYSPHTGRFTSQDPLYYSANPHENLHAFAMNNPLAYSDPYGLMSCPEMADMYNRGVNGGIAPFGKLWQGLRRDSTNPRGPQCYPPPVVCIDCCTKDTAINGGSGGEKRGGYNYKKHIIEVCQNQLDKNYPWQDFSVVVGHELIHAAQYKCNNWEQNSCDDVICKEIQTYTHQNKGVSPDADPRTKGMIKDGVKKSAAKFCTRDQINDFDRKFDSLYETCRNEKPGRRPPSLGNTR